LDDRLAGLAD